MVLQSKSAALLKLLVEDHPVPYGGRDTQENGHVPPDVSIREVEGLQATNTSEKLPRVSATGKLADSVQRTKQAYCLTLEMPALPRLYALHE